MADLLHHVGMPLLVQFGAGNIGRGFIGSLFAGAQWQILFVDVDPHRVAALRQRRCYHVHEVMNESRITITVSGIDAILASAREEVAAQVAAADLVATAVSVAGLPAVGLLLAQGWQLRQRRGGKPVDVLVCENGAQAHDVLRKAVLAALDAPERLVLANSMGFVRTSIGRMIPPPSAGEDPLDAGVEPYASLPVERAAFTGAIPNVAHLEAKDDFDLVLAQKLYLHNLTHACLAYAGHGAGISMIADCVVAIPIAAEARAAGDEAAEALAQIHGSTPQEDGTITPGSSS